MTTARDNFQKSDRDIFFFARDNFQQIARDRENVCVTNLKKMLRPLFNVTFFTWYDSMQDGNLYQQSF